MKKSFPAEIITKNLETDEITDERQFDHGSDSDRRWLGSHIFWALRNNHGVQISPVKSEGN